ncbi:family 16 glycosylhydrolase [Runella zeae]|uniref:family 16 glycosylhydrolase n=1 Tax=Runella zeae TaxID=94255 RepID=UPI0004060B52|nr:family 16 glycosylhydrolase [Runella zeae]
MNKQTTFFLFLLWSMLGLNIAWAQSFHSNKIVAHRGAWKHTGAPQNSLASLQEAIKLGCVGSEFDIRMTKDEVLVINHDAHYEGMDIEQTDFAELRKKPLKNGEQLPTLEEYLKAGKKQKKTMLVAEIKPSPAGKERAALLAEKVVKTVHKLKAQKWVVYISFDYDILKKVRELDTKAKLQYLNGNISAAQLKADNIGGADYHFSVFQKDEEWLTKAQQEGITTNAWTVNDTTLIDYFLGRGIDYITTDEPEKALKHDALFAKTKWKLVGGDEFNYAGLPNAAKWGYDVGGNGWGNNELQFYTEADTSNAVVKNGILTITARKQKHENRDYTSARLVTRDKGEWKYGRIEIKAKLPKGRGTWPAIWMLGNDIKQVGWPKCGEIDIMEHVGYDPDTLVGTIHTQAYNHVKGTQKSKKIFIKNPYTEFHIYAIDWTSEKMDFLLDGKVYLSIPNEHKTTNEWPFDKPHYLLLNIAVGGNWGGAKGIDETVFPAKMEVDYVRVYQ